MTKEFRGKTFKSGNSVALRLPKGLGIEPGTEMVLREERGRFIAVPVPLKTQKVDLSDVAGKARPIERIPFEHKERDWDEQPK